MNVIAIDPGAVTGYAIFKNRMLVDAGHLSYENALRWIAGPYFDQFRTQHDLIEIVVERPDKALRKGARSSTLEDLLMLAIRAGVLGGASSMRAGVGTLQFVLPSEWKGQLPKDTSHTRTLMLLGDLEKGILPKKRGGGFDHNMLDAIGIGLWACKRELKNVFDRVR